MRVIQRAPDPYESTPWKRTKGPASTGSATPLTRDLPLEKNQGQAAGPWKNAPWKRDKGPASAGSATGKDRWRSQDAPLTRDLRPRLRGTFPWKRTKDKRQALGSKPLGKEPPVPAPFLGRSPRTGGAAKVPRLRGIFDPAYAGPAAGKGRQGQARTGEHTGLAQAVRCM